MNNTTNKSKFVALLLCLFFGYFGLHRFYLDKKKSAKVWLCTLGLFGIGWVIDTIALTLDVLSEFKRKPISQGTTSQISTGNISQGATNTLNPVTPLVQTQPPINHTTITSSLNMCNTPEPKQRKIFTLEEAINVYFCTDHWSCKSIYDFKLYFQDAFECILKNIKEYEIGFSDERILRQKEIRNPISETKNVTKATNVNKIKNFIAIDTETTGLKCGGNDIIEICAIKFEDFKPVEKFHTYLKPRNPIPYEASQINGITDEMVESAPQFTNIKSSLQSFIGDYPIVAHNAPFDIKFLHVSGLDLKSHVNKVYDTLHLARLKLRDYDGSKFDSYKLADLCVEQNIACQNYHSADSDTLACGILFVDIVKKINDVENIDELLSTESG